MLKLLADLMRKHTPILPAYLQARYWFIV